MRRTFPLLVAAATTLLLGSCSDSTGPSLGDVARGLRLLVVVRPDTTTAVRTLARASGSTVQPLPLGEFEGVLVRSVGRDGRVGMATRRPGALWHLDSELQVDGSLQRLDSARVGVRLEFDVARHGPGGRIAASAPSVNLAERPVWIVDAARTSAVEAGRFTPSGLGPAFPVPHWSPDDRRIAVVAADSIVVLPAAAGEVRRAVHAPRAVAAAWSPSGQLAVSQLTETSGRVLRVLDAALTEVASIETPNYYSDMQWSPDGGRLAAVTATPAGAGGFQLDMFDRAQRRITPCQVRGETFVGIGGWTPDGRAVVVNTSRRSWLVDAGCRSRRELLPGLGQARQGWVLPG